MTDEDLKAMQGDVPGVDPCGTDCGYDPLYLQLETLAAGEPERKMGDSIIEGKDPDWRAVRKNCQALWEKTRDLRVAAYLALSGLAIDGLSGFADGISLMKSLVADRWDGLWPRLDPDDDNDPLERLNILAMVSPPPGTFDDPLRFVPMFRQTRLVPEGPRYTFRDLLIAEGEIEGGADKVDAALLEAEMTAVPHETMVAQGGLVERIAGDLEAIAEAISEKTAQKASASFETLQNELKTLRRFYAKFVHSAVQPASDEIAGDAPPAGGMSLQARALDPSQVQARNRSEALMLLKKGCDYFRTSEPTSPVPFLVERALRMAEMNFMDLLAEIDPNGVERGRDILGVKPAANG